MASRGKPAARPGDAESRRWDNVPTALEVAEGEAWKAHGQAPNNRMLHERHAQAFNALSRSQGCRFGSWRCHACCTFVTGRKRGQKCGYCETILVGMEERVAA